MLTFSALLCAWAHGQFLVPAPLVEPPSCDPLPPNVVELGPALIVGSAPLPELKELGWPELRAKLRNGDILQYFETGVTGGHLAMRGSCLLGQTNAWIR